MIKLYKRIVLPSILAGFFLLISSLSNLTNAQCSSLVLKAVKTVRNYNNTADSTIYMDKDSSCDYYTVRLKISGYPAGSQFKYYFGGSSVNQTSDTVSKQYVGYNGYVDIKVEVLDGNGSLLCTISRDSMYKLGVATTPKVIFSPAILCNGPDTLQVIDSTPNIVSSIIIIDGTVYQNNRNIKHKISTTGCKKVIVNLKNTDGCTISKTFDSAVCAYNKVNLDFSSPDTAGCLIHKAKFTPSVSSNGTTITSYLWNFSGGNPSTDTNLTPSTITYSSVGQYDVSLQVTNSAGCTFSEYKKDFLRTGDSAALQISVTDSVLCKGQRDTFIIKNMSAFPKGIAYWYSSNNWLVYQPSSKSDTFVGAFGTFGLNKVNLRFTSNGCKTYYSWPARVQYPKCSLTTIDGVVQACGPPYVFKLSAKKSNFPGVGIDSIFWKISDSTGGTIKDSTLSYFSAGVTDTTYATLNKYGKYTARLIIKNSSNGCVDSLSITDYLTIKEPRASMSFKPKVLCPFDSVLISNSTSAFTKDSIRKEFKLFNKLDTSQVLRYRLVSDISPGDTMRYKFTDTGRYVVQLMVYSDFGCRDTIWDTITVASPQIDSIHADTNYICKGEMVNLTSYISPVQYTPITTPFTEDWYFKNKDSSTWITASASLVLNNPGIYDIAYVLSKPGFCKDSTARMKYINVSGIDGDFQAATTSGCKNSAIKFDTIGITNLKIRPSKVLKYIWQVSPSAGVTIANPNAASTNITFANNGTYDVSLKITNADSCFVSITKNGYITIGVVAGFNIAQGGCVKEVIGITDGTQNSPSDFKWTVLPVSMAGNVIFDTTVFGTPANPKLKFLDSGCYKIKQTAYKSSCFDTISHQICIQRTVPKFYASDTFFYCAPQLAHFYAGKSINAKLYKWDFGDGNTLSTTTDSAVNYYETNDSCKDIRLITTDANGCSDTLFIPCYLKFSGPVPKFNLSNYIGCEPLNVSIIDKSYKIKQPTFDFGDGNTQTNGSMPSNHTYYSPGTTLYNVYYPSLSGTDGAGCYAQYPLANNKNPDSVVVYKRAKPYFKSDTLKQCEPMEIQLTDTSKFSTVWRWTITPSTFNYMYGTDSTSQFPIVHFDPGTYTIKLWVTNGSGCADSITKTNYIVSYNRAKAAFSVNDSAECNSLSAVFTNSSTNATSYAWDFGDTKTATAKSPNHTYAPGAYSVKLWVTNANNCADSITKDTLIHVFENPVPKIYSNYTFGCEPFATTLYGDSSNYTDTYNWLVYWPSTGAGISYSSQNPALASGTYGPGKWNVKLIASNSNGCVDSLLKVDYLTIYQRAKASFTTLDTLGCDTLVSNFTNTSLYGTSYKWDFGNGITSTVPNPKAGFGIGQYAVKLVVNNANNCPDSITISPRVIVTDRPKPKMYTLQPKGCEPFTATVYGDSTLYANNYQWDIDVDGTIDFTSQNPVVSLPPGKHSVKVITSTNAGCIDSVTVKDIFEVYYKPTADFVSNKVSTCFGESATFTDVSTSDVALTNWLWDFGDASFDTTQYPLAHTYPTAGFKNVSFYITNSHGCKDTVVKNNFIFVDDSIPPVVTQLQYITVDTTAGFEQVLTFWDVNTDPSFSENKLYRLDPNALNVYSSSNVSDVTFSDGGANLVNNQTYSYYMTTTDTCKYTSQPSVTHTTMLLKASTYGPMTNIITWTPYAGWGINGISKYEIYKNTGLFGNFGSLSLFKTIQPTDTFVIDSLLCDSDYQYVVLAFSKNGTYQSLSNKSMNHPPYISPDTAVGITRSTVVGDLYTNTSWNVSGHSAIKNYIIDRSVDGGGTWVNRYGIVANNETNFTDVNVDVKSKSYTYRVSVEDYCGSYSPTSVDIGKTILLKARVENEYVNLAWTPYEYWANGIKEYKVQLNFNGEWRTLATLNSFDTPFIDKDVHEEITTNYCYRIMALENDVPGDTSISNIGCSVVPSRIWIPNAFTPNDRGPVKNEIFKPILISVFNINIDDEIKKFEFIVYDRWGQQVFYTNDHRIGWDGRFHGKLMPDGIYMWVLRGRGMDGYEYSKNGVVHLIR